jgi:hypothetical protein
MNEIWFRVSHAVVAFFAILFKGRLTEEFARQVRRDAAAGAPAPGGKPAPAVVAPPPAPAVDPGDRAVQILGLLQRDGRLVDFLMEDLSGYVDAQIGAAVRDVHAGCRQALRRYLALDTILAGQEGQPVSVPPGTDFAAVRLVGNVTGQPPFRGTLLHRGWRVTALSLPPLPDGTLRRVLAQAEVEVG